jgi:hypothetical protein
MLPLDLSDDYDLHSSPPDLSYGANLEKDIHRQLHQELVKRLNKEMQEIDTTANPNDEL